MGLFRRRTVISLLMVTFLAGFAANTQQLEQAPGQDEPFTLKLGVDEVSLTFHVSDKHGSSIDNLSQNQFLLTDQGKLQQRISAFHFYRDLPVRVGFIIDASDSMENELEVNEYIAKLYAEKMLRKGIDRAFVMGFGTDIQITQEWTDRPESIIAGIHTVPSRDYGTSGTAIFDSLYKACRDRWSSDRDNVTGNFIVLFTDGVDNASHARIDDVIDRCQRSRTAIYIFTNQWNLRGSSEGRKTLEALTSQSGGRIFLNPNSEQIEKDVQIMDNDQRTQYLLDFAPSKLRRDGSFHHIGLRCKLSNANVQARTGYYAVSREN